MSENDEIAGFVTDISKALREIHDLDDETQDRISLSEMVLEDLYTYFTGLLPAEVKKGPDVKSFAAKVAPSHAPNLAAYFRRLCRLADTDPEVLKRCYEYDSVLYQKHLERYPSLGQLGQQTFGPNNLGIMYLNFTVSTYFMKYLHILQRTPEAQHSELLHFLDEQLRESLAFKTIVDFEKGGGGLWVRDVFSFKAAAADPKGFAGLGRK